MNEKRIIAAIESLRQDIGGRLDSIEQRLNISEKHQKEQKRDIEVLFQRVDALCEDKPIWKSKDGYETAVRTEDANRVFRKLGFSQREALRIIDQARRLVKDSDGKHYKKRVRSKEVGLVRAVVILSQDEP